MFWFGFLIVFVCFSKIVNSHQNSKIELENYQKDPFFNDISLIVELASKERFDEAANLAKEILQLEPTHFDANQLYGSILLNLQQYEESIKYFERGFSIALPSELAMYRNYIEALRMACRIELASTNAARILETFGNSKKHADDVPFLLAYAKVEQDMGNADHAVQLAEQAVNLDPSSITAWLILMEVLTTNRNFVAAESIAYQYLDNFPPNADILSRLGIALQFQRRLNEALVAFQEAEKLEPGMPFILSCLGAVYQELGLSVNAYYYFEKAIPLLPYDAPIRNNFGALLGSMGFQREELYWLKEAVELSPTLSQANMNLAGHYQDEGNLSMAIHYFNMIPDSSDEKVNVDIRIATILSPISLSWDEMRYQRLGMKEALLGILQRPQVISSCDGSLDRLPFYVFFHGLNDRPLQNLLGKVYRYRLKEVGWHSSTVLQPDNFVQKMLTQKSRSLPQLLQTASSTSAGLSLPSFLSRKIRIGFISKFFGVFEPHGMLLDGIMKYLPRSQFHVVCFFVARTDFKVVAPRIQEACDEHHQLSLTIQHVVDHMNSLELDALLFADVISEPINHFLTHMRIAPIQIAFWGNPITTGSQMIDYFFTADIMEHPYRTRIPAGDDAYSEQVWLMEGQGIWYFKPVDPNIEIEKANMSHLVGKTKYFSRADFQLPEKSPNVFLYLLPQSTFKIHPLYDLVLREILAKDERIHIAVTGGRRPSWTARYLHRLRYNLGETYASRLHLIDRVSSENFYSLLSLADGILHPFPFDGSRTSADALQVFVPFVTLPTEYLRGRMGFSFYRTMNISELVAVDVQDYIDTAVKLASDVTFYRDMKTRIRERVDLIWEDMTVPYHATQFLQRVFSLPVSHSYETYLRLESGRYENDGPSNGFIDPITEDVQKSILREKYQSAFDLTYGEKQRRRRKYTYAVINPKRIVDESPLNGAWELDDETYIASLEGFSEGRWPRVFEYWKNLRLAERRPLYIPPSDRIPPVPPHLNESEPFNPFPLKFGPRNASSSSSSALEENDTHKEELDQQKLSYQLTEELQYRPLNVQLTEEATIITDSNMASSLLQMNVPTSINLTTNPLPMKGTPQTSEQQRQQNIFTSSKDSSFYSYDIEPNSTRAQILIEQMQMFRHLLRRGHYDDALLILSNLEDSGHILPAHDAVFHIEKGIVHVYREEFPLALQHCRRAHELDTLMVNALGCIGLVLIYSLDIAQRKEGSRVLFQAIHLHEKQLLLALNNMKRQFPLETNERLLTNRIDDEIISGSGSSVVSMPLDSLLFSYFASLVNLEEFDMCVDTMVQFFNLPSIEDGGSDIVAMAHIAWSKIGEQIIQESIHKDFPVIKHIHYLQERASLLSNFGICLSMSKYRDFYSAAVKDIVHIVEKIHKQHNYFALRGFPSKETNNNIMPHQSLPLIRAIDKSPAAVTVLTQYFRAASAETQKVLDYVLYKNLANPAIDEVHILAEEDFAEVLLAKFPTSLLSKVRQKVIGERLTFSTAFQYANNFLTDRLVALTNADTYFDESLYRLLYVSEHLNASASFSSDYISSAETLTSKKHHWQYRSFPSNTVLALLRWEHEHNSQGKISLSLTADSQDAWIFRPPLDHRLLSVSNFHLGVPRCDNRLAYLFKALNYTVLNPAFDIHAIEYRTSTSSLRTGLYGMKDSVPGAVETLLVNDIMQL